MNSVFQYSFKYEFLTFNINYEEINSINKPLLNNMG